MNPAIPLSSTQEPQQPNARQRHRCPRDSGQTLADRCLRFQAALPHPSITGRCAPQTLALGNPISTTVAQFSTKVDEQLPGLKHHLPVWIAARCGSFGPIGRLGRCTRHTIFGISSHPLAATLHTSGQQKERQPALSGLPGDIRTSRLPNVWES